MNKTRPNKYKPYPPVVLKNRTWPNNTIDTVPQFCAVDLRDGNQALINPLNLEQRFEFWDLLLGIGFTEIEVGFPSASDIDFQFLRKLIEEDRIPSGIVPQVLVQARKSLIVKTMTSLQGAGEAIVHLYTPTSRLQRKVVFQKSKAEIIAIAVQGVNWIKEGLTHCLSTRVRLQFSAESFTGTELDFAVEICEAVYEAWNPSNKADLILNLPATVEMSTPNIYADQIEWFKNNFNYDNYILSVHPHNDRGTAVAAGELALMAGASRIEGTLFGNGERTGNIDLITLIMNMYAQGLKTGYNLSNMPHLVETYQKLTQLVVPPRHPYAGELVFTAFSGSHQDAIKKGFQARIKSGAELWEIPYLPIDPKDVGQDYKSLVRINSQSGKAGVAFVLEQLYAIKLPKDLAHELRLLVQKVGDEKALEISAEEIYKIFTTNFVNLESPIALKKAYWDVTEQQGKNTKSNLDATIIFEAKEVTFSSNGISALESFSNGINKILEATIMISDYSEHSLEQGVTGVAVAYVKVRQEAHEQWGVGIDKNLTLASLRAFLSAVNRLTIANKSN